MLWSVSVTVRRIGKPSTPITKVFAVVADNPHTAEQMAVAAIPGAEVIKATINAHQSMVWRAR
jgi:hypothetical protein